MSFSKFISSAVDTLTGLVRRSSSWDRTMKGVANSVKDSNSVNKIRKETANEWSNKSNVMHKLNHSRPHSAGPLYGRILRDQVKRLRDEEKFNPFHHERAAYNRVPPGETKSASILNKMGRWFETTNIRHPSTVIKKSAGKPPIVKIPIPEYRSQKPLRPTKLDILREINRQRLLCWYQRMSTTHCRNDRRSHKLRHIMQRPPPHDVKNTVKWVMLKKELQRKGQQVENNRRQVQQQLNRLGRNSKQPALIKTLGPQMKTHLPGLTSKPFQTYGVPTQTIQRTKPELIITLGPRIDLQLPQMNNQQPGLTNKAFQSVVVPTQIDQKPELEPSRRHEISISCPKKKNLEKFKDNFYRIPLSLTLPATSISPPETDLIPTQITLSTKPQAFKRHQLCLITGSNEEKFINNFYKCPLSVPVPMIPTHKERLNDIVRQYEEALRNVELPTHSEITASLYTSKYKLETGLPKTESWIRKMVQNPNAVLLRKSSDLITLLDVQPLPKRPPIITVPVTAVNIPSNENEDEEEPGNKTGRNGTNK
ncbi:uncharacterized protein [Halyomorpha halys]|uniref:uncharacterized protein n=1 Tax=Halyomorpha halys TaxID=286706 RepID=UPI0034D214BB